MTTLLETFVTNHPNITLSHTDYREHFHLGCGVNIVSSPSQRVHSYVENDGTPYRFLIVGQVASFKVIEDAVRFLFFKIIKINILYRHRPQFGIYLTVSLGEPRPPSIFSEMFQRQRANLVKIEEDDGVDEEVHDQVNFLYI